jgi:hypothetical protein
MLASNVLQTLLYLPQGLAPNVETIIGVRAIQGVAGSAGNSLVGGFGWSSVTKLRSKETPSGENSGGRL